MSDIDILYRNGTAYAREILYRARMDSDLPLVAHRLLENVTDYLYGMWPPRSSVTDVYTSMYVGAVRAHVHSTDAWRDVMACKATQDGLVRAL